MGNIPKSLISIFCCAAIISSSIGAKELILLDNDTGQLTKNVRYSFSTSLNDTLICADGKIALPLSYADCYIFLYKNTIFPRIIPCDTSGEIRLTTLRVWGRNETVVINVKNNSNRKIVKVIVDDAFAKIINQRIEFAYKSNVTSVLVAFFLDDGSNIIKETLLNIQGNVLAGDVMLPAQEERAADKTDQHLPISSIFPQSIINGQPPSPRVSCNTPVQDDSIESVLMSSMEMPFDIYLNTRNDTSGELKISNFYPLSVNAKSDFYYSANFGIEYWNSHYSYDSVGTVINEEPVCYPLPVFEFCSIYKNFCGDFYFRGIPFYYKNAIYFDNRFSLSYDIASSTSRWLSATGLHIHIGIRYNHLLFYDKDGKNEEDNLSLNGITARVRPSIFVTTDQLLQFGAERKFFQLENISAFRLPNWLLEVKWTKFSNSFVFGSALEYVPKSTYQEKPPFTRYSSNISIHVFVGWWGSRN